MRSCRSSRRCRTSARTRRPCRTPTSSRRWASCRIRRSPRPPTTSTPGSTPAARAEQPTRTGETSAQARLLQDVHAAGRTETDDMGHADLGALDLTVTGLAAQVVADLPDVGDAGRRDRVALGLQAAGHVDRGGAVAPRRPALEERRRAALLAQAEVVVVHQFGGGEAVVQLDEVEVL